MMNISVVVGCGGSNDNRTTWCLYETYYIQITSCLYLTLFVCVCVNVWRLIVCRQIQLNWLHTQIRMRKCCVYSSSKEILRFEMYTARLQFLKLNCARNTFTLLMHSIKLATITPTTARRDFRFKFFGDSFWNSSTIKPSSNACISATTRDTFPLSSPSSSSQIKTTSCGFSHLCTLWSNVYYSCCCCYYCCY